MGVFSFVKAGKKIFGKVKSTGAAIKSVKPNVPSTRLQKASRDLKIAKQKTKAAEAKLKQTTFEIKNPKTKKDDKFTFGAKIGKSESNKERYKRIQKENTEVIKKFIAPKDFNKGGRVGKMGGGMMSRRFGMNKGGKIPTTPKEKKFAALAPPRDRITYSDKIAGATGRQKAAIGGIAIKLGKAAKKFLKSKEGKKATKEIMDNPLPPKMQEQLKRLQKAFKRDDKGAPLKRDNKKGGGPAMSKLPAKEERKQKAQKRMTAANKFVKNRKRSFGSIMREKHMR
jgi:hypothetical protein